MPENPTGEVVKHIYTDKISRRIFRTLLIVLLLLVIALIIVHFIKDYKGTHSKLFWGMSEVNPPKGYPDTVYQLRLVHDTVEKVVYKDAPKSESKSKKTELSQTNKEGDNQANINNGTNNGIIGNNNTLNAPLQPHPSQNEVSTFEKMHPDKNALIELTYSANSSMSQKFTKEFITLLKAAGYKNVNEIVDLASILQTQAGQGIHKMQSTDATIKYFIKVEKD